MRSFSVMAVAAVLSVPQASRAQDTWLPELVAPAPAVLETVTAPYLTDEERKDFRVLHGISDDLDLDTPVRRARVALERRRLDDPVFEDATLPLALRLERLLQRGAYADVVAATDDAAAGALVLRAPRARALAALGRGDEARRIATAPEVREARERGTSVDEVLAAVDLGALHIRLDAGAAGEYPKLLKALARARQELDRLDPHRGGPGVEGRAGVGVAMGRHEPTQRGPARAVHVDVDLARHAVGLDESLIPYRDSEIPVAHRADPTLIVYENAIRKEI
jgi:hypothetical protein